MGNSIQALERLAGAAESYVALQWADWIMVNVVGFGLVACIAYIVCRVGKG